MNRSQRRAAVISWALTAGLLHAGLGVSGSAISAADPGGSGAGGSGAGDRDGSHRDRDRFSNGGAAGPSTAAITKVAPRSAPIVLGRPAVGDSIVTGPTTAAHSAVPTQLGQPADRVPPGLSWGSPLATASIPLSDVPFSGVPPLGTPSSGLPSALSGLPGTATPEVAWTGLTPPSAAGGPASVPAQLGIPAGPPSAAPPVLRRALPAAGRPARELNAQGHLGESNLDDVAVVALPGLVGLIGLTALGGFLGYRQARAGFVLHSVGTARFLQ